jgi:dUTP pyrophosphatase
MVPNHGPICRRRKQRRVLLLAWPLIALAKHMVEVAIQRLAHAEGLPLPAYATDGAAGADLVAATAAGQGFIIAPGQWAMIPTGLMFAIPAGLEVQIRPRSGLAAKHAVTVLNSPGTIDSDYRGEIKILLINLGAEPFLVERGMRIAQMVVAPVLKAAFVEQVELSETGRGAGGFGSTGVKT